MNLGPHVPDGDCIGPDQSTTNRLQALFLERRYAEAETLARELVNDWPAHEAGWKALGAVFGVNKRFAEALEVLRKTLELLPTDAETHNNMGSALWALGRNFDAEASYLRALELKPELQDAQVNLGTLLATLGRHAESEKAFRCAIQYDTNNPSSYYGLGNLLSTLGRASEAEECLRRALELRPDYHEAHNNRGSALGSLGRYREAVESYRRAIALKPDYPEAFNNLGNALSELKLLTGSEAAFRRALELKPDFHEAHSNLGNVLREMGQLTEAEEHYRNAIDLRPDFYHAHNNLGVLFRDLGQLSEAEKSYRCAVQLKPDYHEAHNNLGNVLGDLGLGYEAEMCCRHALALRPDYSAAHSNLLFLIAYSRYKSPADYLSEALRWEEGAVPVQMRMAARAKRFRRASRAGRKLRIGYVSGDFRGHAVSYFMEPIIGFHDRRRVEVFAYSTFDKPDAITERIQGKSDHWHVLAGSSDDEATDLIASHDIDVLIDLAGHTGHARLGIFARRAAPVQCHYLGYFASTGLTEMDYWLGDSTLIPESDDAQYCEKVWRLPRVWVSYSGPEHAPEPVSQTDPAGKVCLGSFNHLGKVTQRSIELWAGILHRVSNSYLLLKTKELNDPVNRERILTAFGRFGVPAARIELLGRTAGWVEHMSLYNRVDIALDPVGGVGGGTTTCDALWMGVPVVTLSGTRHAERMTESMLASIGHHEWTAGNEEEYVQIVVDLAENRSLRDGLRRSMRDALRRSPLCDGAGLARALEDAFESMFDIWYGKNINDMHSMTDA